MNNTKIKKLIIKQELIIDFENNNYRKYIFGLFGAKIEIYNNNEMVYESFHKWNELSEEIIDEFIIMGE